MKQGTVFIFLLCLCGRYNSNLAIAFCITDKIPAAFVCDCSKERVSRALSTLSKKDLDDIINDGESIEVKCQFCNKAYEFSVEELKELRK